MSCSLPAQHTKRAARVVQPACTAHTSCSRSTSEPLLPHYGQHCFTAAWLHSAHIMQMSRTELQLLGCHHAASRCCLALQRSRWLALNIPLALQNDLAIMEFRTAVELQPGYVTAWNNLG